MLTQASVAEIPQDVIDEVVSALNRAIGLAMHKAPDLLDGFVKTAAKLDKAVDLAPVASRPAVTEGDLVAIMREKLRYGLIPTSPDHVRGGIFPDSISEAACAILALLAERAGGANADAPADTHEAIHPGEHLAEYLDAYTVSQAAFARLADLTPKLVSEIINGKAPVTVETAVKLERALGLKAYIWLGLQGAWDLRQARQKSSHHGASHACRRRSTCGPSRSTCRSQRSER